MVTRARLKLLRSLRQGEARRREGIYLAEGRRLVEEALRSGATVTEVLVTPAFAESDAGEGTIGLAAEREVEVVALPARDASLLSDTRTPQGVLAVLRRQEADAGVLGRDGLHLVLDAVADPGNVGTLVRAADAFGARSVLAGPGTAGFENPKVLRSAMGSTFHLPLFTTSDLPDRLRDLRSRRSRILAATLEGEDARDTPPPSGSTCLVLGNEAHGCSPEVRSLAHGEITVRCPGRAESLNVAMAGAILLHHLLGGERA